MLSYKQAMKRQEGQPPNPSLMESVGSPDVIARAGTAGSRAASKSRSGSPTKRARKPPIVSVALNIFTLFLCRDV